MAEQVLMDDLLSTNIDENKVTALVGSLESQLSSASGKESQKVITNSSFNNNHINVNASLTPARTSTSHSQQHTVVSVHNQTSLAHQSAVNSNKIIPQSNNVMNTVKGSPNNPQIIGISSISNTGSPNQHTLNKNVTNSTNSLSNHNPTHLLRSSISNNPSIRIVTNSKPSTSTLVGNCQNPNRQLVNTAMSQQSVSIRPSQGLGLGGRVNLPISASGASSAIHNLATIAAEAKPITVGLQNGNHLQNITKERQPVISQVIVKSGDALRRNGNSQVKGDMSLQNSVIPNVRQGTQIIPGGLQHAQIRVSSNNPGSASGVVVRTSTPQSHVVVRSSVATTMANSSSSVQVVNASTSGAPSLRPVTSQVRPNQVRITSNPVRISSQPNIAPRQPSQQSVSWTFFIV